MKSLATIACVPLVGVSGRSLQLVCNGSTWRVHSLLWQAANGELPLPELAESED